jgi:paraquat-inducible protein A
MMTARSAGLIACRTCGRVHRAQTQYCQRCGQALFSREPASLQRVWAWLCAGFMAYIPANLYPMLETTTLGRTQTNTLLGGVIELVLHHSFGVAAIVFFASIIIPIGKFVCISYLALQIQHPDKRSLHLKHRMLEVVDFIGRWSMIDVFVVALLSSLVQLGSVVSVKPGIAAVSFALSVVFTMLSAMSFDSRLIWDTDSKVSKST